MPLAKYMQKTIYPIPDINYIRRETSQTGRIIFLIIFSTLLFLIIIGRLFQLQILNSKIYSDIANSQHFGAITLNAKRGEILVKDTHSGDFSKLATNTTLNLVYVDPLVAEDKVAIAKNLAPLLFTMDDYDKCTNSPDDCLYNLIDETQQNLSTSNDNAWSINNDTSLEVKQDDSNFKDYTTMVDEVAARILRQISKTEVDFVILKRDADSELTSNIVNERLPGVFVDTKKFMIYADPTLIPENQLKKTAQILSTILNESISDLERILTKRKVRYVFLKNKIEPEISRKIKELKLKGVVLLPEHWRYYPENSLASNIVGFLNSDKIGQYGIEEYFNNELEGKKGSIYAEKDPFGRQITVGKSEIINPVDGDTVILTIDRIVQKEVEKILEEAVNLYHADSGQVVIMDPFTGAIISMANYPTFNPNDYTEVFKLRPLDNGELVEKTVPLYVLNDKNKYMPASDADISNDNMQKYVYENKFGPAVFKNKVVSDYYEPGSVFKPIVMSIALDAKEVEPQTTFMDTGPLKIDEFEIKNSTNLYKGKTTMSDVIAYSLNTGMSFVAKKIGKNLMYQYLKDFGFGAYTNIQLEGEAKGDLVYYKRWSKAQLLTTSFGQGIVVTPLQVITGWCALANGGKLMEPYIVDSIIREGKVIKTEPQIIKRVISEETSSIITAMLVYSARYGYAKAGAVDGYLVAGKTGTSQIAGPGGKYEKGDGATITSFAGYAPALQPKFVILVKFDRPRIGEGTWGETTAAPTFKKITEFLMNYYNIQPSK